MKGQITIYIIIGIILVAVSFLAIFYTSNLGKKNIEHDTDRMNDEITDISTIKFYVQQCLDRVLKKAIYTSGLQGGFIYGNDSLINWNIPHIKADLSGEEVNLSYDIYRQNPYWVSDPPLYPCFRDRGGIPKEWTGQQCFRNFYHTQTQYQYGNLGEPKHYVLPELCSSDNLTLPGYICRCTRCDAYSIQKQLEHYISKKIMSCINFSSFADGKGYDIVKKEPSTNVTIGKNRIYASVNIPIDIGFRYTEDRFNTMTFSSEVPVRFKQLYDIIEYIRNNEVKNLTFDAVIDGYRWANKHRILNISIERKILSNGDTAIIITDQLHDIFGKHFRYAIAIENRAPVLDYYLNSFENPSVDYYNYFTVANETIILRPLAIDPDDTQIIYEFEGWPTDYSWESSNMYIYGGLEPGFSQCINPISKKNDRSRCASYTTDADDVPANQEGHRLKIIAKDIGGLMDWQDIRIFVDDRPEIYFNPQNLYSDIADDHASIEDPYLFNLSKTSVVYHHGPLEFRVLDYTDPITIDWTEDELIYLPYIANPKTKFDPLLPEKSFPPTKGFFKRPAISSSEPITHSIRVEARKKEQTNSFDNIAKQVEVYRCLPHRSSAPSYPFNKITFDSFGISEPNPFEANHTCCGDGSDGTEYGHVKPQSSSCYIQTIYGCYDDLITPAHNYDFLGITPNPKATPPQPNKKDKMLYSMTMESFCDGIHGNICYPDLTNPNFKYSLDLVKSCPICTHCEFKKDDCVPDAIFSSCSDTGRCGPQGTNGQYGGGGKYCCKGGCDSSSTCSRGISCIDYGDAATCAANCDLPN